VLQSRSKRIAETQIAPVKFAPAKIAHVALHVRAKIAIAVVPAKLNSRSCVSGFIYYKMITSKKIKDQKNKWRFYQFLQQGRYGLV
jgi:hypothetical protein